MRSFIHLIARHRVAAVLLFLLVFPLIMPYEALAINIMIFGLFAVGLNLLFGYTGMLSFGHAAFFGVGSYMTGIAMVHFQLNWILAIGVGVLGSLVVGAIVGFLAIRTRGIYFSMVTLALGQIVYYAFYKAERWTGGENGLRGITLEKIHLGGIELDFLHPLTKYYILFVFVALALWFVSRLLNSPFGAVIEAIRENEKRTAACGFDVARSKLLVFVISAGICGLAGTLRALHLSIVPIDSLHYIQSGQGIMMSLLGGMGSFFGPFVGAAVFLYLEDVVTTMTRHWMAVVGLIFMLFVLFFPKGIWGSIVGWALRYAGPDPKLEGTPGYRAANGPAADAAGAVK
jgi:branched-chain amino acid transport system permease protein